MYPCKSVAEHTATDIETISFSNLNTIINTIINNMVLIFIDFSKFRFISSETYEPFSNVYNVSCINKLNLLLKIDKSLVWIKNKSRPKIDPCGTPDITYLKLLKQAYCL